MKTSLWEILVPTIRNDGRPYRLRYHRVWDEKIRKLCGGLSVISPIKGQWVDPVDEKFYQERMIPIRVACDDDVIEKVVEATFDHYDDQIAIMYYRVTDECYIKYREIEQPMKDS